MSLSQNHKVEYIILIRLRIYALCRGVYSKLYSGMGDRFGHNYLRLALQIGFNSYNDKNNNKA